MAIHRLGSLTWPAFQAIARGACAILPTGAIEAHGPHLPLATDVIIAEAMAEAGAVRLAARQLEVVLLPALTMTAAPFAAAFAGTIDVPAAAAVDLISATAASFGRHGVRVLAIANAHHDPTHVNALRSAAEAATGAGSARIVFPDLTRRRWAAKLTVEFQSGACHAGRYEGSIVLAHHGELVDRDRMIMLRPNPSSLVDAITRGAQTFADAGGHDAYFGWPADATAEEGRATIDTLGRILEESVLECLTES